MDKVKKFFTEAWKYLKTQRGVAFYLLIPAVILSLVIPFVYMGAFVSQDKYWSVITFVLPLLAVAAYAMAFFRYTAKYTAVVMFALELAGLLMFADTIYYYVADVVFKAGEGVDVFKAVGSDVAFIAVAYVINIALCIAASFFRQFKENKQKTEPVQTAGAEEAQP